MRIFTFITTVFLAISAIQPASAQLSAPQTATLQAAQAAFAKRDFRKTLQLADEVAKTDPFQAHIIATRVFLELNQLDNAKVAIDRAKALQPKDAGVRILEGVILTRQGRSAAGELALRRAIDLAQNNTERAAAKKLVRELQARRKWKLTGGFGIAPSTNIGKKTTSSTFLSSLGTFTLDDTTISSGVGLRFFGGAGRDLAKFSTGRLRFDANIGADVYDESGFDTRSGSVRLSYILTPKPMSQTAFHLGFDYGSYRSGDTKMETEKFGISHTQFFDPAGGPRRGLRFTAESSSRNWIGNPIRDSDALTLGGTYFHPLSSHAQLSLGVVTERRKSLSSDISNQFTTVSIGAAFQGKQTGFITRLNTSYKRAKWDFAGILAQPREDDEWSFSVTLQNPNISYFGLTPSFTASYLARDSNTALYDVESTDLFLGLTNAF